MATLDLPQRSFSAPTGSQLAAELGTLSVAARDARVLEEILAGNVPAWNRALASVTVTGSTLAGAQHSLVYDVLPDYLALGSDTDFLRMPMGPLTAQAV